MSEEIEALEVALLAVMKTYGYRELTIASTTNPQYQPYAVAVLYADGSGATGQGSTLQQALSAASVDALNSEAAE